MKYIVYIVIFYSILCSSGFAQKKTSNFKSTINLEINLGYNVYFTEDYNNTNYDYHLVLFLHGAGERGDSIDLVEKHGIPKLIKEGKDFPFITLAPQCPRFQYWPEPLNVKILIKLLDEIIKQYRIDEDRIY